MDERKTYTVTLVTGDLWPLANAAGMDPEEYIKAVVVQAFRPTVLEIEVRQEWLP